MLGCIDGTHVPILAPPSEENFFVNMENFHCINIQAICVSDFKFIDVVAKWPGCTVDGDQWIKLEQHFATYHIVFLDLGCHSNPIDPIFGISIAYPFDYLIRQSNPINNR